MKDKSQILSDLVATTPGEEGKWFAKAKEFARYDLALELANQSPCDPKTLIGGQHRCGGGLLPADGRCGQVE